MIEVLDGTITLRRYRVPQIAIGIVVTRPTGLLIVRMAMPSTKCDNENKNV